MQITKSKLKREMIKNEFINLLLTLSSFLNSWPENLSVLRKKSIEKP